MSIPSTENREVAIIAAAWELTDRTSGRPGDVTGNIADFLHAYKAIKIATTRAGTPERQDAEDINISEILNSL